MASYKLTKDAEADLVRIHQYGVKKYGEVQADTYFFAFFDRFAWISENPYASPAVNELRDGYRRNVCGVDSIYYRLVNDQVEIMCILGEQDVDHWL